MHQRKYGYYVLPVLYGSSFVARFEPVLDKTSGALVIKNWWWEEDVKINASMTNALKQTIKDFVDFTGATGLRVEEAILEERKLQWITE